MNNRWYVWIWLMLFACIAGGQVWAQSKEDADNIDSLERMLNDGNKKDAKSAGYHVAATFKTTHIVNGHTIENVGRGVLDFRICHRFGQLNEGLKNLYGLDNATTQFAFDYGITDWLMMGVGRTSFQKEYNGYAKAKILRQTVDGHIPISASIMVSMSARTMDVEAIPGFTYTVGNRLFYVSQLLLARKFNSLFSLQLMPTYLHYNLVSKVDDPNDVLAIGVGGRLKVSKRIALTGEYYYTIPGHKLDGYSNSLSVGVDMETGGHVFQLFITNSAGITERVFIGETTGDILKGAIHLGFNISRVFTVVRPKSLTTDK